MQTERSRYPAPSAFSEFFLCNELYTEYIERGKRTEAVEFFARFCLDRSIVCEQDFELLALLSLDRFMAVYAMQDDPPVDDTSTQSFCSATVLLPEQEWNLILVTILQLTVKMSNCSNAISLSSYVDYFANILSCRATSEDLYQMEVKILKALDYNVTPTLSRCFIGLFSRMTLCSASSSNNSNRVMKNVASQAVQIMEEHCTDLQLMGKPQSLVAFACMRYVMQMDVRIHEGYIDAFERLVDDTIGRVL